MPDTGENVDLISEHADIPLGAVERCTVVASIIMTFFEVGDLSCIPRIVFPYPLHGTCISVHVRLRAIKLETNC